MQIEEGEEKQGRKQFKKGRLILGIYCSLKFDQYREQLNSKIPILEPSIRLNE